MNKQLLKEIAKLISESSNSEPIKVESYTPLFEVLELYIPKVLMKKYDYWKGDSLDGIFCNQIQRTENGISFNGACVLIKSQEICNIHGSIDVSEERNKVTKEIFRIGLLSNSREMVKIPFSIDNVYKLSAQSEECLSDDESKWFFNFNSDVDDWP